MDGTTDIPTTVLTLATVADRTAERGTLDLLKYTLQVVLPGDTDPTTFPDIAPPAWRRWQLLEDSPTDPLEFAGFPIGARILVVVTLLGEDAQKVEIAEREPPIFGPCA